MGTTDTAVGTDQVGELIDFSLCLPVVYMCILRDEIIHMCL